MIFTNETSATCIFNIAAQWPPEATDPKTAQRHTDTMRFPFMSILGWPKIPGGVKGAELKGAKFKQSDYRSFWFCQTVCHTVADVCGERVSLRRGWNVYVCVSVDAALSARMCVLGQHR